MRKSQCLVLSVCNINDAASASACRLINSLCIFSRNFSSSAPNGSSSNNECRWLISPRENLTHCFFLPGNSWAYRSANWERSTSPMFRRHEFWFVRAFCPAFLAEIHYCRPLSYAEIAHSSGKQYEREFLWRKAGDIYTIEQKFFLCQVRRKTSWIN